MLKVGITGGIGSGKSVVCEVFKTLGIPVFNADEAARYLMEYDADLVREISQLLGDDVYVDGKLNKPLVSEIIFSKPEVMDKLNGLVHPATVEYARKWHESQDAPYIIKESAIFFESGTNKEMDIMIGVHAPLELRIERTMKRGNMSRERVETIIARQWDEDKKMKRCKYVIVNDEQTPILPRVLELHQSLLKAK
jgi:dephospho-CoA kinase